MYDVHEELRFLGLEDGEAAVLEKFVYTWKRNKSLFLELERILLIKLSSPGLFFVYSRIVGVEGEHADNLTTTTAQKIRTSSIRRRDLNSQPYDLSLLP